jgi:hypothetical protein
MLADGTYDVFVVDVGEMEGPDDGTARKRELSLTIVAGEYKGEVVDIAAVGLAGEVWELIGMPATVTVVDGRPTVRIDR